MHYYQHHIGDFIKDTNFLTNEEIGIYMKLLWLYYDTEKPLPDNLNELAMKTSSRDAKSELLEILETFFTLVDGEWHHNRCDQEIAEYADFCAKQKANGRKGGRPSKTQQKPIANPPLTQPEPKITLTTNHKPLTTNHIKTISPPVGVSDSVFNDYIQLRNKLKAPVTETAIKGLQSEANKAGISLEQVMVICCQNGWRGFKAEWIKNQNGTFKERDAAASSQQLRNMMMGNVAPQESQLITIEEMEDAKRLLGN